MLSTYKSMQIFLISLILSSNLLFANNETRTALLKIDKVISLDDAIKIALSNNPELLIKKSEVKKAGSEVREISAMRLPSISSTYYWSAGNSSNILSSPQGISPQSSMVVPRKNFNDLNVTMMLPIYTGGTLSANERQAKLMEISEKDMLQEKENEIAFNVTELYYRVLFADEYLKVVSNWLTLVNAQLNRTKSLLEVGKVPKADLLRDEAELANIKQSQTEALNNKETALLDLKTSMGISMDSTLRLQPAFDENIQNITFDEVLRIAINNRPEYKAVSKKAASYKESVRAAKGKFLPQVSLMGMYDLFQSSTMMGENGYTIGVVTGIPIYDGGERRAQVDKTIAEHEKAIAEMKSIELKVENEVRQALLQLNTAAQNVVTAKAALESAREYLRITELRHEAGKSIKVEVYDSILTKVRAELNHLRALYDLNLAKAKLKFSTGGLLLSRSSSMRQ